MKTKMKKILNCEIISITEGFSSPNYEYRVYDNDKTIHIGVSSSKHFVINDANGYHTQEKFDKLYGKNNWKIIFDF